MKLLKNGELGIYIDLSHVEGLNTIELLDEEINKVALGNFDPVAREDDTVVAPSDYIEFLQLRKSQLISALKQQTVFVENPSPVSDKNPSTVSDKNLSTDTVENPSTDTVENPSTVSVENPSTVSVENPSTVSVENPSTVSVENPSTVSVENPSTVSPSDSNVNSSNEIDELKKQLQDSAMIIQKLLRIVKDKAEEEESQAHADEHISSEIKTNPVYNGELNMSASSAMASIKGAFRDIVKNMDPDRKPSDFINVAVARGLLGDDRARLIVDELYTEGVYDDFLERLGGPNGDFSTTSTES